MIKTLRITIIMAAVLAGILFIFPVVFGVRGDGQIEQFLNSAGVIAKFKEATGNKAKESESQVPPLVKQAEAFALYLNPPPKPKPAAVQAPPVTPEIRPPAPVSPKFTLVGVSFYQSHPEQSLAFIDEPGKGLHWVRQSDEVSHLIIEQVKDGSVVVRDGQRTFEIAVQQQPAGISLLESSASGAVPTKNIGTLAASPALEEPAASAVSTQLPPEAGAPSTSAGPSPDEQVNAEEKAALENFIAELSNLQKDPRSDKNGSDFNELGQIADSNEEGATARMKKLMEDLKATRVSAEEAKKLNGLGKELEGVQRDPNLPAEGGFEQGGLRPPAPTPAPPTRSGKTETRARRPVRTPKR